MTYIAYWGTLLASDIILDWQINGVLLHLQSEYSRIGYDYHESNGSHWMGNRILCFPDHEEYTQWRISQPAVGHCSWINNTKDVRHLWWRYMSAEEFAFYTWAKRYNCMRHAIVQNRECYALINADNKYVTARETYEDACDARTYSVPNATIVTRAELMHRWQNGIVK